MKRKLGHGNLIIPYCKMMHHFPFIISAIADYWSFNDDSISDPGIIWDAFKAYQKRKENEKLLHLETQLRHLKLHYIKKPEPITWNNMNIIWSEINSFLQKKTEFALFYTKQQDYEQGERAGKLLEHKVKQISTQNIIPSIFNTHNELCTGKNEINKVIWDFYPELYTTQGRCEILLNLRDAFDRELLEKEISGFLLSKDFSNRNKMIRNKSLFASLSCNSSGIVSFPWFCYQAM